MTDRFVDDLTMWSSLVVYYAFWVSVPIFYSGVDHWYVGAILGLVYVTMHCFEITIRKHCYLSADATAFPVTLIVTIFFYVVAHMICPADQEIHKAFFALPFAFIGGHIGALLYSAILRIILKVIF